MRLEANGVFLGTSFRNKDWKSEWMNIFENDNVESFIQIQAVSNIKDKTKIIGCRNIKFNVFATYFAYEMMRNNAFDDDDDDDGDSMDIDGGAQYDIDEHKFSNESRINHPDNPIRLPDMNKEDGKIKVAPMIKRWYII